MGCPVHIWGPLMASMVPFARVARDRVSAFRASRGVQAPGRPAPQPLRRWAPVQPHTTPPAETTSD